jgi:hypothetical protein
MSSKRQKKQKKKTNSDGLWLINMKQQRGGDIRPNYSSGGTSWGDFGADIRGLLVYIPAAIETGVMSIYSTIKLPGEIAGTLTSDNPPNPNEVHLKGI